MISEMTIVDYGAVTALWRNTENVGLSDADSAENIAAYLARNPGFSFVARCHGEIVGAVLGGHDGRRGYLHHLAVMPKFRKQGLGRALVEESMARLSEAGIQKSHIFIFDENAAGKEFWSRTGWKLRQNLKVMSKQMSCPADRIATDGQLRQ